MSKKIPHGESALFVNGVYRNVFLEILKATGKNPNRVYYLQPYSGRTIQSLKNNPPSPDSPLTIYASTTVQRNEIAFQAEIIGWFDKQSLFNSENDTIREAIINDLNLYQPNEGGLYRKHKETFCANLIVVRNLRLLPKPFPVGLLFKVSDGKALKNRTQSGGWSLVYKFQSDIQNFDVISKDVFDEHFESEVLKSSKSKQIDRQTRLLNANPIPTKSAVLSNAFNRNSDVVAEVIFRANGICELCHQPAPFAKASTGEPYLEVHHWIPLADGGHDTIENAAALCPNCHKQAHFGLNKEYIKIHHSLPQSTKI